MLLPLCLFFLGKVGMSGGIYLRCLMFVAVRILGWIFIVLSLLGRMSL
ncbi:hypothetical protein P3T42_004227 [Paraburkholderia sp. GAS38]|jgi:hypothetical protein